MEHDLGVVALGRLRVRYPHRWSLLDRFRRVVRHLHLVGPLAVGPGPGRDVVRAGLGRGEGPPAVVGPAPVVVRGAGEQVALRIVDAAQVRVAQGAVSRGAAPQIDGVGAPRHQLDGEPVAVARALDVAGGRLADRDPAGRGRAGGEIRSGGFRPGLPRGLRKRGCGRLRRRRGRRVVRHRELVGPLAAGERPGRDVVGAALARGERHPAVVGPAPVVVRGAGEQVAVRIYEDTDIFVDKTDLLRAAQGQRRAADPGCWWSIASIIGPVSDGSRLAPVNEAS